MMPQHANVLGHVFGGVVLSMMDTTAAVSAIRHARLACVTVSVDRVDFREPIHVGDLVIMKSSVNFVGRTSMEIGVRVETENLLTGVRRRRKRSGGTRPPSSAGRDGCRKESRKKGRCAEDWHPRN